MRRTLGRQSGATRARDDKELSRDETYLGGHGSATTHFGLELKCKESVKDNVALSAVRAFQVRLRFQLRGHAHSRAESLALLVSYSRPFRLVAPVHPRVAYQPLRLLIFFLPPQPPLQTPVTDLRARGRSLPQRCVPRRILLRLPQVTVAATVAVNPPSVWPLAITAVNRVISASSGQQDPKI